MLETFSARIFFFGVGCVFLQCMCQGYIIHELFTSRIFALYDSVYFCMRLMMCICISLCLKNDIDTIRIQYFFNQSLHYRDSNNWETTEFALRRLITYVRLGLTYISELTLIAYILSIDSDLKENSIDVI